MQTVSSTIKQIMLQEPYYGLFLCGLNKEFAKVETAAVSLEGINFKLQIDKDFWYKLVPDYRYGLLKHELLHIVFFHLIEQRDWLSLCNNNHYLLNIAEDLEVESYVDEKYWLKDENGNLFGIADNMFKMFPHLQKKMGTKFYIKFLSDLKDQLNSEDDGDSQDSGSSNFSSQQNNGGSGSSNNKSKSKLDNSGAGLSNDYDKLSQEEKEILRENLNHNDLHQTWEEILNNLSPEEQELVKKQTEFQIKSAAQSIGRGLVPGELGELVDRLLKPKPPVFNWKQYFRRQLGINFDIYQKKTRRKESNRFVDSLGLKFKKKHKILVAIDTSGSVSAEEFKDFFSEIYHIYKSGADIHILECDAKITNEYDYKGVMPKKITGRGGTSFVPCIDYYNQHRKDYTICVYFTDGYGDQKECKPFGKMIWIITSNGFQDSEYPGMKICIPKTTE